MSKALVSPEQFASDEAWSRRVFLQRLTFLGGGVLLFGPACNLRGKPVPAPPKAAATTVGARTTTHRAFTEEDYAVMAAAVDRVLPKDQDPGALDADVPEYVDRVLLTPELHQMRQDFNEGLEHLSKRARGTFGKPFPMLADADKDSLLRQFKDAAEGSGEAKFFEILLTLTLEGFLGDPSYGGNKDRVGWALVGFDTWVPAGYVPEHDGLVPLGTPAHHHHGG